MSHARMKTVFLIFLIISPGRFFLLLQLLENLVFVEFPRFLFYFQSCETPNKPVAGVARKQGSC